MDATAGRSLKKAAFVRYLAAFVILGLLIFLPAGTLRYWQAWVLMAVFFIPMGAVLIIFVARFSDLLERRLKMRERETTQKAVVYFSLPFYLSVIVIPALDRRFGWSALPAWLVLAGSGVVLACYLLVIRVMWENRYAGRVVEVAQGQKVIATGPYAIVRHPMYAVMIWMYAAIPVALGSFWGLLAMPVIVFSLVVRILNEEKVLAAELEGYRDYRNKVRFRLIRGVW